MPLLVVTNSRQILRLGLLPLAAERRAADDTGAPRSQSADLKSPFFSGQSQIIPKRGAVLQAVERAQAILARYVEPGGRDCERTTNDLLDVLDRDEVVAAVGELERRGEAVAELRRLLDKRTSLLEFPARDAAEPDLPPMPPERRPQDPTMDGGDMRLEGSRVETKEHIGEYPDTMPQVIEVTDAEGRKAAYVPLSHDGKVVDSSAVVKKLKDCEDSR
jgi:hypothetical protein